MARYRINANAQDLSIQGGVTCQFSVERRHLRGSCGCPVKGVKGQHHILFAAKIAEADFVRLFPGYGVQLKIGG